MHDANWGHLNQSFKFQISCLFQARSFLTSRMCMLHDKNAQLISAILKNNKIHKDKLYLAIIFCLKKTADIYIPATGLEPRTT